MIDKQYSLEKRKKFRWMIYKLLLSTLGRIRTRSLIQFDGLQMYLIPNDSGISKELKVFKVHEPLATTTLKKRLKLGMTVIDIGSNIGYFALNEAKGCGDAGSVIAIEPNPNSFQYLLKNIRVNKLTNVIARNLAIWDKAGFIDFVVVPQSNLCYVQGAQCALTEQEGLTENNVLKIQSTTLDDLFEELEQQCHVSQVDLIRMDVEGGEWQILNGAWHTIEQFLPTIFIEFHVSILGDAKSRSLLNKFRMLGYDIKYLILKHIDHPLSAHHELTDISIDTFISDISSLTRVANEEHFSLAFLLFLEHGKKG